MDARRRNGYADQDAHGDADIDQDAHGNTHLDAHANEDANQHAHANMDARGADCDADQDANEDGHTGRGNGHTDKNPYANACEHGNAYANGNTGWLDAGCVYYPLLRGITRLHPRLAPNRGSLMRR
jgi:hypothetical protein